MQGRLNFVDNLKAFAILLVFIGHSIQYLGCKWGGQYNCFVFNLIYSFHMPLFMALSGFFFGNSLFMPFSEMIKKKSLYILLPAFVWSIPKIVFTRNIWGVLIYNLWFLKSVWICYLVFYILLRIFEKRIAYTIIMLIAMFAPLEILPGYLGWMLPCFMLGIILKDHWDYINQKKDLLYVCFMIFAISFYSYWYIEFAFPQTIHLVIKIIMNFTGVVFFISLFSWFTKSNKLISFIGANTLVLYALNILFCDVITHLQLPNYSDHKLMVILISVVAQLVTYYMIIKVLEKNTYTRLFFLGKK